MEEKTISSKYLCDPEQLLPLLRLRPGSGGDVDPVLDAIDRSGPASDVVRPVATDDDEVP